MMDDIKTLLQYSISHGNGNSGWSDTFTYYSQNQKIFCDYKDGFDGDHHISEIDMDKLLADFHDAQKKEGFSVSVDNIEKPKEPSELKNFYFDFGSWEGYPYGRGEYVKVEAHDVKEAIAVYRYKHPDTDPLNPCVNCADYYDEEQWNQVLSDFEEDHFECMEDISVNDIKKVDLENSRKMYDDNIFIINISECDDEMKDFLTELRCSIYGYNRDKKFSDFKEKPDNYAVHNSAEAVLQAIDDSDISGKFYDAYDESIGIKPQSI